MAKHFQVLVLKTALGTKVVRILLLHLSLAALVHWARSTILPPLYPIQETVTVS